MRLLIIIKQYKGNKMEFYDVMNDEMSIVDAEAYVDNNIEMLDELFDEDDPQPGQKGTIWRNIWSRPRRCTPMSYYLSLKLIETIEDNEITLKQARKKSREQERKKLSTRITAFESSYAELEEQSTEQEQALAKQQQELKEKDNIIDNLDYIGDMSVEAVKKDIRMLFERLSKHEKIELEDLATYRQNNK